MESDRIDKSEYKEAVKKEKQKLHRQVFVLTLLSAAVAGAFYALLYAAQPK